MKRVVIASRNKIRIARDSTDPKELSLLAHDDHKYVQTTVLDNPATPSKVAEELCSELADDDDSLVREAVARRTNDPQLLAKLADDEWWGVRYGIAKRTDDPQILAKFVHDEDSRVRRVAAERRR